MNSRRRNLYLLSLAIVASSCGVAGERYETTINRQWPAGAIRSVELDEVNGSVTVEAGNATEVTLVADVTARGVAPDKRAENEGYFTASVDGDTLVIRKSRRKSEIRLPFFRSEGVTVNYKLRVPATVALDLETVNGRITTKGVAGETEVSTVNGPIEIEMPGTAELTAQTVNGRVRARFLESFQGANLRSVNGGIEASLPKSASFSCDLSQVNGDFEASFPLSINSNPGSRRVSGEVNGGAHELRIVTVNGDIELARLSEIQ
jgi:molybdopterin-binding protein